MQLASPGCTECVQLDSPANVACDFGSELPIIYIFNYIPPMIEESHVTRNVGQGVIRDARVIVEIISQSDFVLSSLKLN